MDMAGSSTRLDGFELLADTLGRLCQGQVTEVRSAFQTGRSREDYFASISGKTAALTATSCRIGALTGGLSHKSGGVCAAVRRSDPGFAQQPAPRLVVIPEVLDVDIGLLGQNREHVHGEEGGLSG